MLKAICMIFVLQATAGLVKAEVYEFVGTSFPLILEENKDGEVSGLGAEIAQKILHNLGHTLTIRVYPWKRAQTLVSQGKADVLIGPYKTTARESFLNYNRYPFYQDSMIFYVREKDKFIWDGEYASLQHKEIGIMRGWSYGAKFDRHKDRLNIQVVDTVAGNFKKLMYSRIDMFASNSRNSMAVIKQLNIGYGVKVIPPPISINKGYFGFSKKRKLQDFLAKFDEQLKNMIDSGELQRLNQKYQLDYSPKGNSQ